MVRATGLNGEAASDVAYIIWWSTLKIKSTTALTRICYSVIIIIIIIIIIINMIKTVAENILKCKDLTIGIQRTWNLKAKVISVITGSTGTISKSLRHYLSNIPR